jgi:hypothetical protein
LRARRQANPDHPEYLSAGQQQLGGDPGIDWPNDAGQHGQCLIISATTPGADSGAGFYPARAPQEVLAGA